MATINGWVVTGARCAEALIAAVGTGDEDLARREAEVARRLAAQGAGAGERVVLRMELASLRRRQAGRVARPSERGSGGPATGW